MKICLKNIFVSEKALEEIFMHKIYKRKRKQFKRVCCNTKIVTEICLMKKSQKCFFEETKTARKPTKK